MNIGYETNENQALGYARPARVNAPRAAHTIPEGTFLNVAGPRGTFGSTHLSRNFNRGAQLIRLGVGYDSAIGSLFEDEALILPDPHFPIRLKQANFFQYNETNNRSSIISTIILNGGAYTSLRLRVSGVPQVPASGNKGDDIEIDYTLIDPENDIIYLCEFKKGFGAQKKGDAVQLNRAAVVLSYHYQKIHKRKPKIYALFVAGAAVDALDIDLPDKESALSDDISFFSNTRNHTDKPTNSSKIPFVVHLVTATGFAKFAGIPVAKVRSIMGLRNTEHVKFGDALLAFERYFTANPDEQVVEIKNVMNKFPNRNWPDFWKISNNQSRVDRLIEIDAIPSLVFKKREYEKTIKNNAYNMSLSTGEKKSEIIPRWLAIIELLSKFKSITPAAREKYTILAQRARGVLGASFKTIQPNIDLKEQIILRRKYLGKASFSVSWPIPRIGSNGSIQSIPYTSAVTAGVRIQKLHDELKAILKSPNGNVWIRVKNFGIKLRSLPVLNPTTRKSAKLMKLQQNYNNAFAKYTPKKRLANSMNLSMFGQAAPRRFVKAVRPRLNIPVNSGPINATNTAIISKLWSNSGTRPFAEVYRDFVNQHTRLVPNVKRQLNSMIAADPDSNQANTARQALQNMQRITPQLFV